jgi:DNA-binding response OmpR family regulator
MTENTILLVDDIPEYLDTMEINLPVGCRAVRAASAEQARKQAETERLALAVVDVRLHEGAEPNRDGLDLLRWLRANHPNVPVIVISAYREFEFEAESLELGAEYFLKKPIRPNEFRDTVAQLLNSP